MATLWVYLFVFFFNCCVQNGQFLFVPDSSRSQYVLGALLDTVRLLGKLLLLSPVPAVYSACTHTLWERKKAKKAGKQGNCIQKSRTFGERGLAYCNRNILMTLCLERVECVSVSPQLLCDVRNKGVQRDEHQQA